LRVLIAEDDPVIALALVERIRSLGHEPIGPVADGEQAVAEAVATRPRPKAIDQWRPARPVTPVVVDPSPPLAGPLASASMLRITPLHVQSHLEQSRCPL
jgi:AmiR/NasT family two-component response regulator